jgi:protein SCO1
MERKFVWVGLAIFVILGIAIGAAYLLRDNSYHGVLYNPAVTAYDFQLESGNGEQVSLHDFRGKLVLLFFGFTNCTDICPTTLAILSRVNAELGEQASRIQVVYITVDPQRDTPQRMQEYVAQFDPTFIGLSGSESDLQKVWSAYGVYREIDPNASQSSDYEVTHSTRLYMIDQEGKLFLSFDYGTPPATILHDVRLLLGSK